MYTCKTRLKDGQPGPGLLEVSCPRLESECLSGLGGHPLRRILQNTAVLALLGTRQMS